MISDALGDGPELEAAEVRARRAFGLTIAPDGDVHRNIAQITRAQLADRSVGEHQRPRFVQDGDVPVVYVTGSPASASSSRHGANRLVAAEIALESERQARQRAERARADSQSAVNDIQTRFDHADLARAEADGVLLKLRVQNGELKVQLVLARRAQREAEEALQQATGGRMCADRDPRADEPAPVSAEATSKLRGRPPT